MPTSRWSIRSEDSFLSIASKGSVLSIGSVGSFLSIGSIGSACSLFSVGSFASVGSALSSRSRWSLMSHRSVGRAIGRLGHRVEDRDIGTRYGCFTEAAAAARYAIVSRMAEMSARVVRGFTIANRVTVSPPKLVGVTNATPSASSRSVQRR